MLVAGGYNGSFLRTAVIYDPQSGGWSSTGSLTSVRSDHTATLLPDGAVLITGGVGYNGNYSSVAYAELYEPSEGTWVRAGDLNTDRLYHSAVLLNDGSVLVLGGEQCCTINLTSTELYKPSRGPWYFTGSLNVDRSGHTATLLNDGRVLAAGGVRRQDEWNNTYLSSSELYDPLAGSWTLTGQMSGARYGHTATLLLNGKVLVVGGGRNVSGNWTQLDTAELYDPQLGTWSSTGSMAAPHGYHTATRLLDGRVLVVQGGDAEQYDPGTGLWSSAGALITPRLRHSAVLLDDGRVLVMGGIDTNYTYFSSCEIYDPTSNTWQATGSMSVARADGTENTLSNGSVLVAGGWSDTADRLASAEIYNPASGAWSLANSLPENTVWPASVSLSSGAAMITGGYTRNEHGWERIMFQSMIYTGEINSWYPSGRLGISRKGHSATRLNDGRVLVAGGDEQYRVFASAEIYQAGPQLAYSPVEIKTELSPDLVASMRMQLSNSGGDYLDWTLTENPPRTWLSVPASGSVGLGITDTLTVTIDTHGLSLGETYTTTLHLSSNDPVLPQVDIPVDVLVSSSVWLPLALSSGYLQSFDYTGKCVSKFIGEAFVTWCVPRVDILLNQSMQVYTTWQVRYYNPDIYCVWKHPDTGNAGMYLVDNQGNWYDHSQVGEAAAEDICIENGETVQGWFLFPQAEPGAVTFAFYDEDQDYVIEDISLGP